MEHTTTSTNTDNTFTNIYINNIDKSVTEEELRYLCEYGGRKVRSVVLMTDERGISKGYGFCNFETHSDALSAISTLNLLHVGPKKITASPATSRLEREKFRNSVHKMHSPSENPHIYIKNLDYAVMEEDLRRLFCQFGHIINIRIIRNKIGQSKGFGFVSFDNFLDAQRAISSLNGIKLGKLCVSMSFYESKDSRLSKLYELENEAFSSPNKEHSIFGENPQDFSVPNKEINNFSDENSQLKETQQSFSDLNGCARHSVTPFQPLFRYERVYSVELYAGPGVLNEEAEIKMFFYDFDENRYSVEPVFNHRNIFVNRWLVHFCLREDMLRALAIAERLFVKGRRVIASVVNDGKDYYLADESSIERYKERDMVFGVLPSPDIFVKKEEEVGIAKYNKEKEFSESAFNGKSLRCSLDNC